MGEQVIHQLRPGETTPDTFCGMLLQNADEMEHIACVVQWKSGKTDVFQTMMTDGDVAWLRWVFDQEFRPD